jgi:hypothetical protein
VSSELYAMKALLDHEHESTKTFEMLVYLLADAAFTAHKTRINN